VNVAEIRTTAVLGEVAAERDRQDAKWGEQNHVDGDWSLVLAEEYGEACKEALGVRFSPDAVRRGDHEFALREELLQVAAVAVAWVEAIDRRRRT
jgi:hypothetical protein